MDAKPQRLRSTRVPGDENAPILDNKTLHQRHKSTGTLSTMIAAGGLKVAAKRSAFGEIGNTHRMTSSKDDTALLGKTSSSDFGKNAKPLQERKSAALLRPAQRPLSVSGVKGLTGSQASVAMQSISEAGPTSQPPLQKKTVIKRKTTVFKDEVALAPAAADAVATSKEVSSALAVAPVHKNLAPRHHKSQPHLKDEKPVLRKTKSRFIKELPTDERQVNHLALSSDAPDTRSDGLELSGRIDIALPPLEIAAPSSFVSQPPQSEQDASSCEVEDKDVQQLILEQDRALAATAAQYVDSTAPKPISEPEEYWEDEDNDTTYDDEGYTTARSYRSRDNTTGGPTVVLFPKVTAKARREIASAKQWVESMRTEDDAEDEYWDITMVSEYSEEIFVYMKELEIKMLPNPNYMDNQSEIQWSMRSVLMDWVVQVHLRFTLLPETLFLCVNYIDRFLSCKVVSLGKLQLVGATALFIAAKYEEINPPNAQEMCYMVDGSYTIDEILKAERFMLSMLQFELGWPGPMSFLRKISKADDYDLETRTLAKYFLEISIMDERFVGSPPSYIAAGAHCLSREMLRKGPWASSHVHYSGYTYNQLRPLLSLMMECCENPLKHHAAVYDKYKDRKYKRAATFVESEIFRGFILTDGLSTASIALTAGQAAPKA